MSVTLGAYSTLPNPTSGESRTSVVAPGSTWEMANGSLAVQVITTRLKWSYSWRTSNSTDAANIRAAGLAAMAAPVSFTPYDSGTSYTVIGRSYEETHQAVRGGTVWSIACELEETTA